MGKALLVVGLVLALAAPAEARETPPMVRYRLMQASYALAFSLNPPVPVATTTGPTSNTIQKDVVGHYGNCPRPALGVYRCSLRARWSVNTEPQAQCSAQVIVQRSGWRFLPRPFGCPSEWLP